MGVVDEIGIILVFFFFFKILLKLENSLLSYFLLFSLSQVNCSVPKDTCLFLEGLLKIFALERKGLVHPL